MQSSFTCSVVAFPSCDWSRYITDFSPVDGDKDAKAVAKYKATVFWAKFGKILRFITLSKITFDSISLPCSVSMLLAG